MKALTRKLVPKRGVSTGSSESMGRGAELAVSVGLFTVGGLALDGALGTRPWMTIGLVCFAMAGNFVRMYYGYSARMETLERERRERGTRR